VAIVLHKTLLVARNCFDSAQYTTSCIVVQSHATSDICNRHNKHYKPYLQLHTPL